MTHLLKLRCLLTLGSGSRFRCFTAIGWTGAREQLLLMLLRTALPADLSATRLQPFSALCSLGCLRRVQHSTAAGKRLLALPLRSKQRLSMAASESSSDVSAEGVCDDSSKQSAPSEVSLLVAHGDYILLARLAGHSTNTYGLLQGSIQANEEPCHAAARVAQQLAGIAIDKSSITSQQNLPSAFKAQTSKQDATSRKMGLDLLQGKARACAIEVRLQAHEVETVLANPPPQVQLDPNSIIAAQWFNKHWLIAHSQGKVPATPLRLVPGKDPQSPGTLQTWLEEAKSTFALDQVPDVVIETGVFKYVLLVVSDLEHGQSKLIVRGDRHSGYHMDVFEKTVRELTPFKLHVAQPLGGGRIRHDDGSKAITIYGYSSAYGQAPHDLSAAIVRQWYPMYAPDKVTASYEGY